MRWYIDYNSSSGAKSQFIKFNEPLKMDIKVKMTTLGEIKTVSKENSNKELLNFFTTEHNSDSRRQDSELEGMTRRGSSHVNRGIRNYSQLFEKYKFIT